jgi:hypothetical protein
MVFNLTHSQIILRYKENGRWSEPYYSNHAVGIYAFNYNNFTTLVQKRLRNWKYSSRWLGPKYQILITLNVSIRGSNFVAVNNHSLMNYGQGRLIISHVFLAELLRKHKFLGSTTTCLKVRAKMCPKFKKKNLKKKFKSEFKFEIEN